MLKILVVTAALSLATSANAAPSYTPADYGKDGRLLLTCKGLIKKCEKAGGMDCAAKYQPGEICRANAPRAKRSAK